MTTHARVAIIGGGVAGCALLYHLTQQGCTDVVLLEKSELTSGSTWHAAGNVPHYMGDVALSRLHKASLDFYSEFSTRTGRDIGFHQCGSLKLALDDEHLEAFERDLPVARELGIPFEILELEDIARLCPFMWLDGVLGAAWTPDDGHLDPASLTNALADEARQAGGRVLRRCEVLAISRTSGGEWELRTEHETVIAEHVVNAAGLHAREVSALLDHTVPAVPMERQYLVTESLPEVEALAHELPVIRDTFVPMYARQERDGLLFGLYESDPVFWAVDGTPRAFDQELLQPDLERLAEPLARAMQRLPMLNDVGIKRVINGPLMRTPDAAPLIGPVAGIENYWLNTGYFAGIAQSGGCTALLARWILEGEPGDDVSAIDVRRFDQTADMEFTMEMTRRAYLEAFGLAETQ